MQTSELWSAYSFAELGDYGNYQKNYGKKDARTVWSHIKQILKGLRFLKSKAV